MAAAQQSHRHRKSTRAKSKGGGSFACSTSASRLKQVTRASATPAGQGGFVDQGARCESLVLLKNLAKRLVDRIEAACAARNYASQVSNPSRVLLNAATESRLLHGPNPGSEGALEKADKPHLTAQKRSGHPGDSRSSTDINGGNRKVRSDDDRHDLEFESQSCSRGTNMVTRSSSFCETCRPDSRPSSQPNPSGTTSEVLDSRPSSRANRSGSSSRPPTREWTSSPGPGSRGKAGSVASRMLPLKKVNVGLDDCEMPRKREGVHPTPRRKMRSPGLRSLVVPQVKNPTTAPARPPANTKLVLESSGLIQKHTEADRKEEPALKEVGELESEDLYKAVWADVVESAFDGAFRVDEEPSHPASRKRSPSSTAELSSRSPRVSEEWIIQTQSVNYRSWGPERAGSRRRGGHKSADADNQYLKLLNEEITGREPSISAQRRTRSKEDVGCKPPVILPTVAKYHMDKIERYKKCVAEKQLRERRFQQECRPSTAPDPYNVLNVYAERCASQKYSRSASQRSEHALDWQVDERREVDNSTLADQPNFISRERVPTRRNEEESCKAMSAGSIPGQKSLQYQPLKTSHTPEVDRPHEKPINLRQETRDAAELSHKQPRSRFEEKLSETKSRITSQKQFLSGVREDQRLQQATANTEAVSKKTRFRDHWPFLDRQIEAFIQAHILQCCIIFKNVPLVFPTLEYQEEIQRLYSDHPLST